MSCLQGYLFCVETQRCRNIFGDKSDNGERNSGTIRSSDDKLSHQGGLSLNDVAEWHHNLELNRKNLLKDFHAAVMTCSGTQKGGGGQIKKTSSSPQKTACTGTQSRGSSISNTASGVGGSEPPEDGRGKPLIPGHYSASEEAEEEDDGFDSKDDDSDSKDESKNPGNDAGVVCNGCTKSPQSCKIFFTGDKSDDVFTAIRVYCSQKCAENAQIIVSVNLWDTESSSIRKCLVCFDFDSMPLTVCRKCGAYMCGRCSKACKENKDGNGRFRCPVCTEDSGIIIICLPDCISRPANLIEVHLFSQRRSLELDEQERQHRRRQLDDENRRLEEADIFEALFPVAEVQGSRPPVCQYRSLPPLIDRDDHETPAGPPTEDFHPPVEESSVQQEIDDPVVEEDVAEQESHQPQEIPASKESEEEDDDDEGVQVISTGMNEEES